jgi:ElaB/YqjD/DUF883 family membrane-anchored ribosome-binding protein
MSQSREEFMAKWGIQSEQELRDIVTMLQSVMESQFKRLRPRWSQEYGEETLQAVERMPTYYPSTPTTPIALMLTGYQDYALPF